MLKPVLPGATLGVLGGGQLGRMFAHAAQQMGYGVAVLDPDAISPTGSIAHHHVQREYLNENALSEMARLCDAVTTEFENVPARALDQLAQQVPVAPSGAAVSVCQNRAREKAHFTACGVPCAPYAVIECDGDVESVASDLLPGILKTSQMGYDGKGQVRVRTLDELRRAWVDLKRVPCVLEKMLPLAFEVSVIVARHRNGQVVHFPLQQNLHRDGILAVTTVPAPNVTEALQTQAIAAAEHLVTGLQYVGVLCIEFFVLQDGSLVVNEMAPRPHNSGHYTIDACDVSQFDLQVRCMTNLPLVAPRLHSAAVMLNVLGDVWFASGADEATTPAWQDVVQWPGVHLHLYGKTEARRGRKMGHITITAATLAQAQVTAQKVCERLGLPW